jgi:hypothetical protein
MKPGGERDHPFSDVDANNRSPTFRGPRRGIPRPRCDVEEPDAAANSDRIKQSIDKQTGDLAEEVVVAGRLGVPPRDLKRRERVYVDPPSARQIDRMPRWSTAQRQKAFRLGTC